MHCYTFVDLVLTGIVSSILTNVWMRIIVRWR